MGRGVLPRAPTWRKWALTRAFAPHSFLAPSGRPSLDRSPPPSAALGRLPAAVKTPRSRMPAAAPSTAPAPSSLTDLKQMKVAELAKLARSLEIEAPGALKKQDLIFAILQAQSKKLE